VRRPAARHAERHRVDQVAADRKSRAGGSLLAAKLREKLRHRNGIAALTLSDRLEQASGTVHSLREYRLYCVALNGPTYVFMQVEQPLTAQVLDPRTSRWKNGGGPKSQTTFGQREEDGGIR
jgi:hypothetical protein